MNTKTLTRQRLLTTRKRSTGARLNSEAQYRHGLQYPQYQNHDKNEAITETAHTGDPSRSFKMLFQYEEAARYRSQTMRDDADKSRLLREARLAQRMRDQGETGARRARRALAGLFLG
jgi:hypothetical protein